MKLLQNLWLRIALLGLCLAVSAQAVPYANSAAQATPKPGPQWLQRHQEFVQIAKQGGINVLFLGDSITDYWRTDVRGPSTGGKAAWDKYFVPLHAANFGIASDRIQNVLWRVKHGELDNLSPKVVVLMIGTNNLSRDKVTGRPNNQPAEVVMGTAILVREIRARLPFAKILLLGIFPRGPKGDPYRGEIQRVNLRIAKLDDGKHVHYLDIGPKFLQPDGTLSKDIMSDLMHPTAKGYQIWADAIKDPVAQLLK
jgi:lysophospholipase L1-like esterase